MERHHLTNGHVEPGPVDPALIETIKVVVAETVTTAVRAVIAGKPAAVAEPPEQLVSLDQLAAICGRTKKTLKRYSARIPGRRTVGGGGVHGRWAWHLARSWLANRFGVVLPEKYPGLS